MFHTIQEVAERMRMTPKTVRGWILDGRLGAIKFGRVYRVRDTDLNEFLDKQTVEATTREKTT
jgi:excisionase family DNA binding protein|tara:strand:+ start:574 stop:762 length:189 start_codon:yes stop_codon:yes gene_type:complete